MSRNDKLLHHIDKQGYGIEIGPSYNPVAPKRNGFRTQIIDHLSREDLVRKFTGHPVNVDAIEEVDFIWRGESYTDLTGREKFYDWIIASHVIEHTPDLIAFLNDCDRIMKETGILSLAVPDKRYCFDYYRPVTGLARVIDSHLHKTTRHTPGTLAEYYLNAATRNGKIVWDETEQGAFALVHPMSTARNEMEHAERDDSYVDAHAWCFTPHSFRLMIHDLSSFGFISLKEVSFIPGGASEFYIALGRTGRGIPYTRLDLLNIVDAEARKTPRRPL